MDWIIYHNVRNEMKVILLTILLQYIRRSCYYSSNVLYNCFTCWIYYKNLYIWKQRLELFTIPGTFSNTTVLFLLKKFLMKYIFIYEKKFQNFSKNTNKNLYVIDILMQKSVSAQGISCNISTKQLTDFH